MIIEFTNQERNGRTVCLLHFSPTEDKIDSVDRTFDWLIQAHFAVLPVPNGHPCPGNPRPKMFIYNTDNEVLMHAINKIAIHGKPGAFVALTKAEMQAYTEAQNTDMVQI